MAWIFGNKRKRIKQLLDDNALILDVRNENEFAQGHCSGSKNIPLSSLSSRIQELDKNQAIIACCASGIRSGVAKGILKSAGFTVINGGGWQKVQNHLNKS